MKISSFDRQSTRLVADRVEEVLASLGKELGVQFSQVGGKFNFESATLKIQAAVIKNGKVKSPQVTDFENYATSYGLKTSDLGKQFKSWDGIAYEIVGLAISRRKRPVVAKSMKNGKMYLFSIEDARKGLRAA